jgi:flagellar biosynthesis/type III secretory pathway protein FliH
MIGKARVIKGAGNAATVDASVLLGSAEPRTVVRRVSRFELEARDRAAAILADAEARAETIVTTAREAAKHAKAAAETEAREHEAAKFAAHYVALKLEEDSRLARETDRLTQLATILAERLIGGELSTSPLQIQQLAESAIAEARGAGALTLEAHPEDAETLRRLVRELRSFAALTVRESSELQRGSLLVHTELGTLDARLRPQLERLASHLTALLRA